MTPGLKFRISQGNRLTVVITVPEHLSPHQRKAAVIPKFRRRRLWNMPSGAISIRALANDTINKVQA
ncbi:hypothetical protein CEXT_359791 [Caerostris extrusa]|uniref:Uncharacterized protein n=1 Tax=Caerostris extrusa TaxID=172846 RepID=A0AAV4SBU3_CAEEX|nr:hypothetical protein CEXT_359791 [Caerostris extrusa]